MKSGALTSDFSILPSDFADSRIPLCSLRSRGFAFRVQRREEAAPGACSSRAREISRTGSVELHQLHRQRGRACDQPGVVHAPAHGPALLVTTIPPRVAVAGRLNSADQCAQAHPRRSISLSSTRDGPGKPYRRTAAERNGLGGAASSIRRAGISALARYPTERNHAAGILHGIVRRVDVTGQSGSADGHVVPPARLPPSPGDQRILGPGRERTPIRCPCAGRRR